VTTRRLAIERLELDLRGVAPELAESAVRLLGPALRRALTAHAERTAGLAGRARIDAGRVEVAADADAQGLADRIAHQLVASALPAATGEPS
jgi:hypothetical protein